MQHHNMKIFRMSWFDNYDSFYKPLIDVDLNVLTIYLTGYSGDHCTLIAVVMAKTVEDAKRIMHSCYPCTATLGEEYGDDVNLNIIPHDILVQRWRFIQQRDNMKWTNRWTINNEAVKRLKTILCAEAIEMGYPLSLVDQWIHEIIGDQSNV